MMIFYFILFWLLREKTESWFIVVVSCESWTNRTTASSCLAHSASHWLIVMSGNHGTMVTTLSERLRTQDTPLRKWQRTANGSEDDNHTTIRSLITQMQDLREPWTLRHHSDSQIFTVERKIAIRHTPTNIKTPTAHSEKAWTYSLQQLKSQS